jgi:predicted nucleotidyltransferase
VLKIWGNVGTRLRLRQPPFLIPNFSVLSLGLGLSDNSKKLFNEIIDSQFEKYQFKLQRHFYTAGFAVYITLRPQNPPAQPMYPHHTETISNIVSHFKTRDDILAVLLTGSVAHGFSRENSDVDIAIIVGETDFQRRKTVGELTFYDTSLCSYPDGYVDGKYMDLGFIRDVAQRGSEPARFAFKDATVLSSKIDGLEQLLSEAAKYPHKQREANLLRFQTQFEVWYWYVQQAFQTQDRYLLQFSVSKLTLFGCRQILAHNRMLFPYHKWLTRVVAQAPSRPDHFLSHIDSVLQSPTPESTGAFYKVVNEFVPRMESEHHWSTNFIFDSELNWMSDHTPVDDL